MKQFNFKDIIILISMFGGIFLNYINKLEFNRRLDEVKFTLSEVKSNLKEGICIIKENFKEHTTGIKDNIKLHSEVLKDTFRDKIEHVSEHIVDKVEISKQFNYGFSNSNNLDILFAFKIVGGVCIILGTWYITSYYIIPYYKSLFFVNGFFFSNAAKPAVASEKALTVVSEKVDSVVDGVNFNPETKTYNINCNIADKVMLEPKPKIDHIDGITPEVDTQALLAVLHEFKGGL